MDDTFELVAKCLLDYVTPNGEDNGFIRLHAVSELPCCKLVLESSLSKGLSRGEGLYVGAALHDDDFTALYHIERGRLVPLRRHILPTLEPLTQHHSC